jgi:Phage integrase, N-terminal SAM-like domain
MIRLVIITSMGDNRKAETSLEIQRYAGTIQDRSRAWTTLETGELRRRAVEAARDRDLETLWAITEAHLGLMGQPSVHTLRAYKTGLGVTLEALSGENVLRPSKNWGLRFIRELEVDLKASSVRSRLASARALFAALRWAQVRQNLSVTFTSNQTSRPPTRNANRTRSRVWTPCSKPPALETGCWSYLGLTPDCASVKPAPSSGPT